MLRQPYTPVAYQSHPCICHVYLDQLCQNGAAIFDRGCVRVSPYKLTHRFACHLIPLVGSDSYCRTVIDETSVLNNSNDVMATALHANGLNDGGEEQTRTVQPRRRPLSSFFKLKQAAHKSGALPSSLPFRGRKLACLSVWLLK